LMENRTFPKRTSTIVENGSAVADNLLTMSNRAPMTPNKKDTSLQSSGTKLGSDGVTPAEAPTLPAAHCTGLTRFSILSFMEETDLTSKRSLMALNDFGPINKAKARNVPPHYLGVANWVDAAYNTRYWFQVLSKDQQDLEWRRYNLLSEEEKSALKGAVNNLMEDRTFPRSALRSSVSGRSLHMKSP